MYEFWLLKLEVREYQQTFDTISQQLKEICHGLALMGHQNLTGHHDTIL
jgi:hypothetical protein